MIVRESNFANIASQFCCAVEEVASAVVGDYGGELKLLDYARLKALSKCPPPPPGLGDRVAAVLDAIGVTKERAQAVASAVGIKDCGCQQRQQKWNEWGAKHLGIGVPKQP